MCVCVCVWRGGGQGFQTLPEKVAIGFLRNTGTVPSRSNLAPRVQVLLEGGSYCPP